MKTLVKTLGEGRRTHCPDPRRCEFDRKWKAIEVADDLNDVTDIVRSEREPWAGCDGTIDEETRGRSLRRRSRTRALVRNRKRPDAPHQLARKSEYLTTRGKDGHVGAPAEESLGEGRNGAAQVLAVVEYE